MDFAPVGRTPWSAADPPVSLFRPTHEYQHLFSRPRGISQLPGFSTECLWPCDPPMLLKIHSVPFRSRERQRPCSAFLLLREPGFSREGPWASPLCSGPPGLRLTSWSALAEAYFGPPMKIKKRVPQLRGINPLPGFSRERHTIRSDVDGIAAVEKMRATLGQNHTTFWDESGPVSINQKTFVS